MEYKFSDKENYEDFASGRVIYGNAQIPNYPVRLVNEIFRRSLQYCKKKDHLTVYDPCCGGGYLLTVLGLCNGTAISRILGSDIDETMLQYARKNLGLLTKEGLNHRIQEINNMLEQFQKESHKEALDSALRLKQELLTEMESMVFQADCTKKLLDLGELDVIITDIPYGNLVSWKDGQEDALDCMLSSLAEVSNQDTILALSMDKKQKYTCTKWRRLEKQNIGKRRFELLQKEGVHSDEGHRYSE